MLLQIARVIVREVEPERVILFGSHARGDAGPDCDVDAAGDLHQAVVVGQVAQFSSHVSSSREEVEAGTVRSFDDMTKGEIDLKVVADRTAAVRSYVEELRRLPSDSLEEFLADRRNPRSAGSLLRHALVPLQSGAPHLVSGTLST